MEYNKTLYMLKVESKKKINLMASIIVEKDQLCHFSHRQPLSLGYLQQLNHNADDEDEDEDEGEDEDEDDFVEEDHHGGQCNMCNEQIWSFHLCYYYCKSCDYSLHKFVYIYSKS
ncbi:hypothetical protein L1987_14429 [Smallanthus sonchifolius]|uniref:Uncharacterized protein n=1 Tax=Smallanthus sonchifolius TaxID=185202 RepID=A0ACB9J3D8_9ASTR|nr:hypothetical protein L1987_14429 [Smallanthus sonchifolius]